MSTRILLAAVVSVSAGCGLLARFHERRSPPPPGPPTFSRYHLAGWPWDGVARVLVLPVLNGSPQPRAADDVRDALASELQRLGRFEVTVAPPDDRAALAATIHRDGRFDEAIMLDLAHRHKADVIVHVAITQYSPYPRPRIGLVIQAVDPQRAKVIASVDGLWDTTDNAVAERVRAFYRQKPRPSPPWVRNHVIASDDSFAGELALDSPALFLRYISHESALVLTGLPVPGVAVELCSPAN